jgi:hypothetical protein
MGKRHKSAEMDNTMKYIFLLLLLTACTPSSNDTTKYGYGPSIMLQDGVYYTYFCSAGSTGWDAVRLTISRDNRKTWGAPEIMLDGPGTDRCACDPSIVFFKGYYYLFYSGNVKDVQTVNYVSRSLKPTGPFLKYGNGRWGEVLDPMPIISPKDPTKDGPGALYGAGQPSVIVRGDTLLQWYTDVELGGIHKIKFTTSTDGINWTPAIDTNLNTASIDVKFNTKTNKYNMYGMGSDGVGPAIWVFESDDGITWTPPVILHRVNDFAHNPGVSGNERGELIDNGFVGFGAPRDYEKIDRFPEWDLYFLDLKTFIIGVIVKTKG